MSYNSNKLKRQVIASKVSQEHVTYEDNKLALVLFGERNANLHKIEEVLGIDIDSRGNEVCISGKARPVGHAKQILEALWAKLQQGEDVDLATVESALRFIDGQNKQENGGNDRLKSFSAGTISIKTKKKVIQPRSPMQAAYIQAMQDNQMVFAMGPAGTGKTYLAVAMAVAMLEKGKVERIILSRPALEAGEQIGFLPGEIKEKMDPYMRPLYDALQDTMSAEKLQKKIASEEIEIAPLAFMRGRTLKNAFVILDEAQNTSAVQMKMALTRLGENASMVVTGDPSQTDLPERQKSGLLDAMDTLKAVDDIAFISFTDKDVVRATLVAKIIKAYDTKNRKE